MVIGDIILKLLCENMQIAFYKKDIPPETFFNTSKSPKKHLDCTIKYLCRYFCHYFYSFATVS